MNSLRLTSQLALAACAVLAFPAHADVTIYTSLASFQAAAGITAADAFSDLQRGTTLGDPTSRSAGSFSYSLSFADQGPLKVEGTATNSWVATQYDGGGLVSNFSPGVTAFGADFIAGQNGAQIPNRNGAFLKITDSSGTYNYTTGNGFVGFVSSTGLISVAFYSLPVLDNQADFYSTIDNVVLGSATAAVPEPGSYALMLGGLVSLAALARRRRAAMRAKSWGTDS